MVIKFIEVLYFNAKKPHSYAPADMGDIQLFSLEIPINTTSYFLAQISLEHEKTLSKSVVIYEMVSICSMKLLGRNVSLKQTKICD